MDADGFDRLARTVSGGTDRRRVLTGLLGAALAGSLGGAAADAKGKRQRHKRRVKAQKGGNKGNSPTAKSCQKGGWATLARAEGAAVPFVSEEECVSYGAQGGVLVVVNPCHGEPDLTSCSGGVCCGEQCQAGECCPENNAGCTGDQTCDQGTCWYCYPFTLSCPSEATEFCLPNSIDATRSADAAAACETCSGKECVPVFICDGAAYAGDGGLFFYDGVTNPACGSGELPQAGEIWNGTRTVHFGDWAADPTA
jgi:hypothetical protein